MRYLEILVFVLIGVYSTIQDDISDAPTILQGATINGKNITFKTEGSTIAVDPQPSNSTTLNPNITTSKPTPTIPPTTSSSPTTPITKPTTTPPSNITTTPATNITTTPVPSSTTTNATTFSPITTAKPVDPSTPIPDHHRRFDGPSFVGGIVLALGLVAIGFVAFKFYKARTELNYHTL